MDALFGFPARNDAECCKRELLGRSWRRDWAMHNFQHFPDPEVFPFRKFFSGFDAWGNDIRDMMRPA